jgi:hypothetical protein
MNEEQILLYKKMEEYYGKTLANFEHEPKLFAWQVKLYKYLNGIR